MHYVRSHALLAGSPSFISGWALSQDGQYLVVVKPDLKSIYTKSVSRLDAQATATKLSCEPLSAASMTINGDHLWLLGCRNPDRNIPLLMLKDDASNPPSVSELHVLEPPGDGLLVELPGAQFWTVRQAGDHFIALGSDPTLGALILSVSAEGERERISEGQWALENAPTDVAPHPQNDQLLFVTTGHGRSIEVWDRVSKVKNDTLTLDADDLAVFKPTRIKFQPGTNRFWVSSFNQLVSWDFDNNSPSVFDVTSPDDCVVDFDVARDGRVVAACAYSNRVAVISSGEVITEELATPWAVQVHGNQAYVLHYVTESWDTHGAPRVSEKVAIFEL